jgi:hypothetical protein
MRIFDMIENGFERLGNWIERLGDGIERAGDRLEASVERLGDEIERAGDRLERGVERLGDEIERAGDRLDEIIDAPSSIITPEIREKLNGMRVLLVGGHPSAPLAEINEALTDAGLQVCWERHDMHLIPKNFDLIPLRPNQLLVNNTNLFNVVIVDWQKQPFYEWHWCPHSIFSKFGKGTLRIGIGPEDKRDFQLGEGAKMFLDYDQFLVEDLEPLLLVLATALDAEKQDAASV